MTSLEARMEALKREIAEEIRLMEAQLAKSTAARTASASLLSEQKQSQPVSNANQPSLSASSSLPLAASGTASASSPTAHSAHASVSPTVRNHAESPSPSSPASSPTNSSTAKTAPSSVVVAPVTATHKEGTLLHLVRSGGLFGTGGTPTFVPHYVIVSDSAGISWYAKRSDYLHQPQRPLGHADFFVETYNSRGSRFKKAAVCWPLILQEDCPAANDPTKAYFAVDYYTSGGCREQLVLAANSSEERDAWVQVLTRYIDLYLAPRAESEELQHITRGAAVPLHRSGVIEGEAPGGNIL